MTCNLCRHLILELYFSWNYLEVNIWLDNLAVLDNFDIGLQCVSFEYKYVDYYSQRTTNKKMFGLSTDYAMYLW